MTKKAAGKRATKRAGDGEGVPITVRGLAPELQRWIEEETEAIRERTGAPKFPRGAVILALLKAAIEERQRGGLAGYGLAAAERAGGAG
jgi:hypothetical protein